MQTILTPVELQPAFFFVAPQNPGLLFQKDQVASSVPIERLIGSDRLEFPLEQVLMQIEREDRSRILNRSFVRIRRNPLKRTYEKKFSRIPLEVLRSAAPDLNEGQAFFKNEFFVGTSESAILIRF